LIESGEMENKPDEVSVLDVDLKNTKADGDVVKRIILPNESK